MDRYVEGGKRVWKRAFVVLLTLNVLVGVLALAWITSFPTATSPQVSALPQHLSTPSNEAVMQVAIGDEAINSFLNYDLPRQHDLKRVLASARVSFAEDWNCRLDIKLLDRQVPFVMTFSPAVHRGNLDLHLLRSSMGGVPLPDFMLFLVFRHLPWPGWIILNSKQHTLDVNFTNRPPRPYSIRVLSYSAKTKQLTLAVGIEPSAVHTPA